ncbi:cell division ATP-binding protein FtsE [Candidatus Gottesmanbacteria bacterium RIFCSPHIGHO2_02_FULL_39_11]|uniref:Cell division ATP-binding protein FtsE n=1 Tax=Candidatus Gottesmanbacteria bacterium RIFCSPHIGHO2_02_FULL_39_11 TaxID=1798382 RepID=A0A1F5ZJU9_9BACT|nr:MAG: cell division ATP-binding protein FtsE [Candidatus Gottesmanbacteria bacterium RIFCSPHIGHO2_02_FULL_39_11]
MIRFVGISKTYPSGNIALKDINLSIADGEFVFLIGSSGAGKTTLLRLLDRELAPTSGHVYIDDVNISSLSKNRVYEFRRKMGFVFQDFKLLSDRTAAENIGVVLEIMGRNRGEIEKKVKETLQFVGLTDKMDYFPVQLSLGEQQRVAIARAIIGGAKILLTDEPTGNLDPKTSWEILKIISDINKSGTTVIMATHNADIVNSMRKRVITLKKGEVIKDEKKSRYG